MHVLNISHSFCYVGYCRKNL